MPERRRSARSPRRAARALTALLALLALVAAPAVAFEVAEYEKAAKTILCDCGCHPQSVHDCACGRAAEMRDDVRKMIEQGMSGDQVIAAYVAQHGEKIRIAPKAEGFNLLAWLGPLVALVVAGGGMLWLLRRWTARRAAPAAAAEGSAAPLDADDPYVSRLRRELEELQ